MGGETVCVSEGEGGKVRDEGLVVMRTKGILCRAEHNLAAQEYTSHCWPQPPSNPAFLLLLSLKTRRAWTAEIFHGKHLAMQRMHAEGCVS